MNYKATGFIVVRAAHHLPLYADSKQAPPAALIFFSASLEKYFATPSAFLFAAPFMEYDESTTSTTSRGRRGAAAPAALDRVSRAGPDRRTAIQFLFVMCDTARGTAWGAALETAGAG